MGPLAILSGIGAIFGAVGDIAKGWFAHKTATIEAARDVELAEVRAGVEVQQGSWKDEYFTIFWTVSLYPPLVGSIWYWDPYIFVDYVNALPVWYTTILIGMTTASFGMKTFKSWKAGVLGRELTWDRHEKNRKKPVDAGKRPVEPPKDSYEAVRPSPLPPEV